MTTVGLPLAIWGEGYSEFLPRWWDGVMALQRKPDEIAIVADKKNLPVVMKTIGPENAKIELDTESNSYASFWNKAISLLNTDWIAICNVDDKFLPEALNDINRAQFTGCNLICDQIQDLDGGQIHKSQWNGKDIGKAWTMVGAEPMRRDLFLKSGGFPEGYRFADWALAMHMYWQGVKAYDSNTIRIIYDRGLRRKTTSSILNNPMDLQDGYAKLSQLSATLGF